MPGRRARAPPHAGGIIEPEDDGPWTAADEEQAILAGEARRLTGEPARKGPDHAGAAPARTR